MRFVFLWHNFAFSLHESLIPWLSKCSNPGSFTMELLQFCTRPSISLVRCCRNWQRFCVRSRGWKRHHVWVESPVAPRGGRMHFTFIVTERSGCKWSTFIKFFIYRNATAPNGNFFPNCFTFKGLEFCKKFGFRQLIPNCLPYLFVLIPNRLNSYFVATKSPRTSVWGAVQYRISSRFEILHIIYEMTILSQWPVDAKEPHDLIQCWPTFTTLYVVTRPRWVIDIGLLPQVDDKQNTFSHRACHFLNTASFTFWSEISILTIRLFHDSLIFIMASLHLERRYEY